MDFANSGGGIDMNGSTPPTANKQSCSSFLSLEEDKGSADVEATSEDMQLRTGVTSKSTGKYCSWAH